MLIDHGEDYTMVSECHWAMLLVLTTSGICIQSCEVLSAIISAKLSLIKCGGALSD